MSVHAVTHGSIGVVKAISIVCCAVFLLGGTDQVVAGPNNGDAESMPIVTDVPKEKQTALGLYVTAAQAYEQWQAAPDRVKIIDVRTPEEYAFVGHPEMALNIPYAFVAYKMENGKAEFSQTLNTDFVADVKQFTQPGDTLMLICRSGGRSAMAVDLLAAAGIRNVYSVIDGVEGDKVTDPASPFFGKRMTNGWKNSAPWIYDTDPAKFLIGQGIAKQADQ